MLSIGSDELGNEVNEGDMIRIDDGTIGTLKWSKDDKGNETKILGYIDVNGTSFVAAIDGMLVPWAEKICVQ